jgi:hypothetical protein
MATDPSLGGVKYPKQCGIVGHNFPDNFEAFVVQYGLIRGDDSSHAWVESRIRRSPRKQHRGWSAPIPSARGRVLGRFGSVSRHVSPRSRRIRELGRFLRYEVIAIFEESRNVSKYILNEMPRQF